MSIRISFGQQGENRELTKKAPTDLPILTLHGLRPPKNTSLSANRSVFPDGRNSDISKTTRSCPAS
jgi:hypothetical protein